MDMITVEHSSLPLGSKLYFGYKNLEHFLCLHSTFLDELFIDYIEIRLPLNECIINIVSD